ncbi:MAG: MFS transporter, partial [Ktedonobacteraceae bacterium]
AAQEATKEHEPLYDTAVNQKAPSVQSERRSWLTRSTVLNAVGTLIVVLALWGLMTLWNMLKLANVQIGGDVQQVVLEAIATIGILRLFDFNPRRDPDFAWVLLTRMVMMMGIYTVQDFLQFYMRDAVKVSHPEQQTTNFIIILSLTSLVSALAAGWLSDRFGRKRIVYISGTFMALVGLIFIVTQSLPIVLAAGAIFGLGYGAYVSVDWALVADVLPSHRTYARDMGVWNISLSVPQVIAPVIGGPLIDSFTRSGNPILGFQLLFAMSILSLAKQVLLLPKSCASFSGRRRCLSYAA